MAAVIELKPDNPYRKGLGFTHMMHSGKIGTSPAITLFGDSDRMRMVSQEMYLKSLSAGKVLNHTEYQTLIQQEMRG